MRPSHRIVKRRSVPVYGTATLGVMIWGYYSRRLPGMFPAFLGKEPGDALWTLMIFAGVGLLLPKASTWCVAGIALGFSCAIEISQLYQAPWINSIRATSLGHLVLGSGFHWPDFLAYTVGTAAGVLLERMYRWIPTGQK